MDTFAIEAQHARDRGPTKIDIEDSDSLAPCYEREGQLCGDRGFADASLSGHDEDDVLDTVKLWGLLHRHLFLFVAVRVAVLVMGGCAKE
jgi:hypothetical protein